MLCQARRLIAATLIVLGLFAAVQPAAAYFYRYRSADGYRYYPRYFRYGYHYGYRDPYYGYRYAYSPYDYYSGYTAGDPYGGYLSGAASVINAQGQYLVNTQQAYLLKEKVRAAQIDNKRNAFNEWLYEKAHTPTLNETREEEQAQALIRAMTTAPETEIWSGYTLNVLLANLQKRAAEGIEGPYVPLEPATLKQINVTVNQQGNVGLLNEAGKLPWPFALRALTPQAKSEQLREQIDTLLVQAKKQAASGQVGAELLTTLNNDINQLRSMLLAVVDSTSFNDYVAAKNFLNNLGQAATVLGQADVAKYVNGTYSAQGHTVEQLIAYMTQHGLQFAPAVAGQDGAYESLYQSLRAYPEQ
jgi:hypothetical protein